MRGQGTNTLQSPFKQGPVCSPSQLSKSNELLVLLLFLSYRDHVEPHVNYVFGKRAGKQKTPKNVFVHLCRNGEGLSWLEYYYCTMQHGKIGF